jgi:hypothetical protein
MYTQELIDEVKYCYPDYKEMHKLAEEGSVWLGRYLDDSCSSGIHIDKILLATSLDELQHQAKIIKRKINCYKMWCEQDPRKQ